MQFSTLYIIHGCTSECMGLEHNNFHTYVIHFEHVATSYRLGFGAVLKSTIAIAILYRHAVLKAQLAEA